MGSLSDWVIAVLTVVLVGATIYYAKKTRDIAESTRASVEAARESAEASRAMVAETQRQHRLSHVPLFAIKLSTAESFEVCRVSIRNTSQVPALDVRINLLDRGWRWALAFTYPESPNAPVERRSAMPPSDTFQVLVAGRSVHPNDRSGGPQRKSMQGAMVDEGTVRSDEFMGHADVHVSYVNVFGARFSHQERWELWQQIVAHPAGGDWPIKHLWLEVGHPVLDIHPGLPIEDAQDQRHGA